MSAPIIACAIADAMGPLLTELNISLGAHVSIERFESLPSGPRYVVYIHDGGRAFQGTGDTPSRAVMVANSERQKSNILPAASPGNTLPPEPGTTPSAVEGAPERISR